jgi:hypothetical protein
MESRHDAISSKNLQKYGTEIMKIIALMTILLIVLFFSGCGIPDLPGPLGIPGV